MIGLETLFDIPGPHFPEARTLFDSFSGLKCGPEKKLFGWDVTGMTPKGGQDGRCGLGAFRSQALLGSNRSAPQRP